jgi:hypothetical protein
MQVPFIKTKLAFIVWNRAKTTLLLREEIFAKGAKGLFY